MGGFRSVCFQEALPMKQPTVKTVVIGA